MQHKKNVVRKNLTIFKLEPKHVTCCDRVVKHVQHVMPNNVATVFDRGFKFRPFTASLFMWEKQWGKRVQNTRGWVTEQLLPPPPCASSFVTFCVGFQYSYHANFFLHFNNGRKIQENRWPWKVKAKFKGTNLHFITLLLRTTWKTAWWTTWPKSHYTYNILWLKTRS